jgi:hypothetical protein
VDDDVQIGVDDWFKKGEGDLSSLVEILDLPDSQNAVDIESGQYSLPPDDSMFDLLSIESGEDVSKERYEALEGGAQPTSDELALWREKYEENIRGGDGGWFLYTIWRFNSHGKEFFIVTMRGDGGVIEQCVGPFETLKSAQTSLVGNIF